MGNGQPPPANTVAPVNDPSKTPAGTVPTGILETVRRQSAVIEKLIDKHRTSYNWTPPKPEKIPGQNTFYYMTAPVRLKRLFGSPLAKNTEDAAFRDAMIRLRMESSSGYATLTYEQAAELHDKDVAKRSPNEGQGPNGERRVSAGWKSESGAAHIGLDYMSASAEPVLACASGKVSFVGYQNLVQGAVQLPWAHIDETNGSVLNVNNEIAVSKPDIGENGIGIIIRHDGDFPGYQTEYYHLSKTFVSVGDAVTEGQPIGETGTAASGQLHLTLAYFGGGRAVIVDPTVLVPNYFPGHSDSTTPDTEALRINYINPGPGGQNLIAGVAATGVQTIDRSTDIQNLDRQKLAESQANHMNYTAQVVGQQQQQLYESVAKFQQAGIIVVNPMTFDFEKGYWVDGTGNNRPV